MRRLAPLLLLLFSACYDSAGEPSVRTDAPVPTTTLAELRRLWQGKTFAVTNDIILSGYVTSDDRAGSFYRTLVIEDNSAAAEIMAGIDGLHNIYPMGCRLAINLNGLAVGESRGILQIGRVPAAGSGYSTDFIGSRAALNSHLFRSGMRTNIQPPVVGITDLSPAMAGCLVRIDGLRFMPDETEPSEWAGTKRFTDSNDNVVFTYTRIYADFAAKEIPSGEVLLVGILQCDRSADDTYRYTLKLRDETDCWN